MTPEEGVVGAELVPPDDQLAVSIAEETANISTCRSECCRHTCQAYALRDCCLLAVKGCRGKAA